MDRLERTIIKGIILECVDDHNASLLNLITKALFLLPSHHVILILVFIIIHTIIVHGIVVGDGSAFAVG